MGVCIVGCFLRSFTLFCCAVSAVATYPAERVSEKIAEGEFETVPAVAMTDPKQSWILWREADGKLRLEDHFTLFDDPALMMLAAVGPWRLDPKARKEVADKVGLTGLEVLLTPDWNPQKMIVHGVSVADGKSIELVNCKVSEVEVSCKGLRHDAKFKKDKPRELFYSFHFPLLLRSLALRAKVAPNQTATVPLVELRLGKEGPELLESEAKVVYVGDEVLSIADYRFASKKYSIETTSKAGTLTSLIWLSGNDVVLAAQNQDRTLQRVLMSRFKKISDF